MTELQNSNPQFAICVNTNDPELLTPRMVYQVLPDENAARSNYVRVVDNEGEDYLYPAEYFVLIDVPPKSELTLLHTLPSHSQVAPVEHGH